MKKFFSAILNDLKSGDNIDAYGMLIIALAFGAAGVIGKIEAEILSAIILGTLSILAINTLNTRRTLRELSGAIKTLRRDNGACLQDRSAFSPFKDFIAERQTIWFFGPSLISVFPPNDDFLRDKIKSGSEVRVLVYNPHSPHLDNLAQCLGVRPSRLVADIRSTLESVEESLHFGLGKGSLEVRLTDIMPGYSMVIVDPDKEQGQMVVEFNGHDTHTKNLPHVTLNPAEHQRWYAVYLGQYRQLWEAGTVYSVRDGSKKDHTN
ncbi:MAG: hypothetical protein HUU32_13500 [Calditrichaceae bacterium]|nr:hypothetical protein [Calditrichia bacterium]NUQ42402.1 hypothetical protein [Calditrichaceae bacterium]